MYPWVSGDGEATRGAAQRRARLRGECTRCHGLCCVAPALTASADFAIGKPAGRPCPNLLPDLRCGIHDQLRERGFPGCRVFDCFGAGQQVSEGTFAGRDWRTSPELADRVFAVFAVMRRLHELLWYLVDALARTQARELHPALRERLAATQALTETGAEVLTRLDVAAHRAGIEPLLRRTSELVRGEGGRPGKRRRGADLIGAHLAGADLRAADLRGSYLIGSDLRRADLRRADLIGADLRGADLSGADLREALFLTQPQVDAARGDLRTVLPASVTRPGHWPSASGAG